MRAFVASALILILPPAAGAQVLEIGSYVGTDCLLSRGLTPAEDGALLALVPPPFKPVLIDGRPVLASSYVDCAFWGGRAEWIDVGVLIAAPDGTEGTHAAFLARNVAPGSSWTGYSHFAPVQHAAVSWFSDQADLVVTADLWSTMQRDAGDVDVMADHYITTTSAVGVQAAALDTTWWLVHEEQIWNFVETSEAERPAPGRVVAVGEVGGVRYVSAYPETGIGARWTGTLDGRIHEVVLG